MLRSPSWLVFPTCLLLLGFTQSAVAQSAAPSGSSSQQTAPLFSRHIVPLFSRLGCNAGLCHGAVQGKNGFRLSLFGVEPALDHERLVRESGGRRLNLQDPDASLLLLKATGQVPTRAASEWRPAARNTSSSSTGLPAARRWIGRAGNRPPTERDAGSPDAQAGRRAAGCESRRRSPTAPWRT